MVQYTLLRHRGDAVFEPRLPSRSLKVFSPLLGHENPKDYSVNARRSLQLELTDMDISLSENLGLGFAVAHYLRESRAIEPLKESKGLDGERAVRLPAGKEPEVLILSDGAERAFVFRQESALGGAPLFIKDGRPVSVCWPVAGRVDFLLHLREFEGGSLSYRSLATELQGVPASPDSRVPLILSVAWPVDVAGAASRPMAPLEEMDFSGRFEVRFSVSVSPG